MSMLGSGAPGCGDLADGDAAAAVAELRAYLRADGTEEEALLRRFAAAATASCELFTGQVLLARSLSEVRAASAAWTRLRGAPVRAITGVAAADRGGVALPADAFAIDIDGDGDGWVRLARAGPARVRVDYQAGLAADWDGLPAPLRSGIVRLAAHMYAMRAQGGDEAPPAAVSALWRPFRRVRLGFATNRSVQ